MRQDFDLKFTGHETGFPVDYGFITGNNTIVLIKAGLDGSLYGYENKYLAVADKLNTLYGYTVVAASNPSGSKDSLKEEFALAQYFSQKLGHKSPEYLFMGVSNGAYLGITESNNFNFRKMLLVNMPLMMNFHRIQQSLKAAPAQRILLVYGENDQSIRYTELLTPYLSDNIQMKIIPGADHQFKGRTEEFINLPLLFF